LIGINSSTAIIRHAELDGLFRAPATPPFSRDFLEIGRLIPKVAETEQISNRRNSPLNSRAKVPNGSGGRCFVVRKKNIR
jgi:hypothetical protein